MFLIAEFANKILGVYNFSYIICPKVSRLYLRFRDRVEFAKNKITERLFQLMESKKTTLCLEADLTSAVEVIKLAEIAGPLIAVFKIHSDIISDFSDDFIENLREIAKKYDFLIMEDRKFADVEHIVAQQFAEGMYRFADWADLVTVHTVAGRGTLKGIEQILKSQNIQCGVFLVTEMSSSGALTFGDYVRQSLIMADDYMQLVVGHVCQGNIFYNPGLIQMTNGAKIVKSLDEICNNNLEFVVDDGEDLVVIGQEIIKAETENRLDVIKKLKDKLWRAYQHRLCTKIL